MPSRPQQSDALSHIREELAQTASADYADQLYRGTMTAELHRRVEAVIKRAIEGAYRVGQLAAMPELVDRSPPPRRLPAPGESGFDAWCLTDPESRPAWQRDPQARRAIDLLWRSDPAPERTLAIEAEIDELRARGEVEYARLSGDAVSHYYCCPWAPIYTARVPVTVAGRRVDAGAQFVLDVSAEEMAEGGDFTRQVIVGQFSVTDEVDYCDPRAD